MNRRLPVVGGVGRAATGPNTGPTSIPPRLPVLAASPTTDTLARNQPGKELSLFAGQSFSQTIWGRVHGKITKQTDLQEELGIASHALCGGI